MIPFRVSRRRRLGALLAFALQLCVAWTSVSGFVHDDSDDPACNPALVLHDHNAHHMGAARGPAPHGEHCVICHILSLRSLVASAAGWAPDSAEGRIASHCSLRDAGGFVCRRAARAPPLA